MLRALLLSLTLTLGTAAVAGPIGMPGVDGVAFADKKAAPPEVVAPPGSTVVVPEAAGVVVPWGGWAANLLSQARDLIMAVAGVALTALTAAVPVYLRPLVREFITDRVLSRAVDNAIARSSGFLQGQSTTLPPADGLLRMAEEYVVHAAPDVAARLGAFLIPRLQAQLTKAGVVSEAPVGPQSIPKKA